MTVRNCTSKAFVQRYYKRWNEYPNFQSEGAYVALYMLKTAIERANKVAGGWPDDVAGLAPMATEERPQEQTLLAKAPARLGLDLGNIQESLGSFRLPPKRTGQCLTVLNCMRTILSLIKARSQGAVRRTAIHWPSRCLIS